MSWYIVLMKMQFFLYHLWSLFFYFFVQTLREILSHNICYWSFFLFQDRRRTELRVYYFDCRFVSGSIMVDLYFINGYETTQEIIWMAFKTLQTILCTRMRSIISKRWFAQIAFSCSNVHVKWYVRVLLKRLPRLLPLPTSIDDHLLWYLALFRSFLHLLPSLGDQNEAHPHNLVPPRLNSTPPPFYCWKRWSRFA